jgi:ribosome-associated protein
LKEASHRLARRAAEEALRKKASDVLLLDLREMSGICDWFVIATGDSEVQVKAIADQVEEGLRADGMKCWHVEGYSGRRWILLDYVDVVVHVFHREAREFYLLEKLWGDAEREKIE